MSVSHSGSVPRFQRGRAGSIPVTDSATASSGRTLILFIATERYALDFPVIPVVCVAADWLSPSLSMSAVKRPDGYRAGLREVGGRRPNAMLPLRGLDRTVSPSSSLGMSGSPLKSRLQVRIL